MAFVGSNHEPLRKSSKLFFFKVGLKLKRDRETTKQRATET